MTRGFRKLVLTAHITLTVSWIGAVVSFLVLAINGLASQDFQVIQSAYVSMESIARFVIVPLSFAPLLTGPILSLGTPWGLFRHYWILVKLVITILCTIIMQLHIQPIIQLADTASNIALHNTDTIYKMQIQMVAASIAALAALLTATTLAVYKPRGMTTYGWSKQYEERITSPDVD